MAVHACVKGFGGEAFLRCFGGGGGLKKKQKRGAQFCPETLNDKRIKRRKKRHIFATFPAHTQSRLPTVNHVPNTTFLFLALE